MQISTKQYIGLVAERYAQALFDLRRNRPFTAGMSLDQGRELIQHLRMDPDVQDRALRLLNAIRHVAIERYEH